jgi:quercetin dioxygenase-like cupin family protein
MMAPVKARAMTDCAQKYEGSLIFYAFFQTIRMTRLSTPFQPILVGGEDSNEDPNRRGTIMERDDFVEMLAREGFKTTVLVERKAGDFVDGHTHAFEAKALILEGEITLRIGDNETRYQTGDVFHLEANEAHSERCGPEGVCYLVGRK